MIPTGKGVFIWQLDDCAGGDPIKLANQIKSMGFSWVAIKMANGYADVNRPLLPAAVAAFRAMDIKVIGWHYVYGATIPWGKPMPELEATAAIRNIDEFDLSVWVVDPEKEYKRSGASAWASTYMSQISNAFPTTSLGLCSYRYPTLHTEIPWNTFLTYSDFHMPQVYWVGAHDPDVQLIRSHRELMALKNLPFIPVGAAYYEHAWEPFPADLDKFDFMAHKLELPGVGWWCWDDQGIESHPLFMQTIKDHCWLPQPPLDLLTPDEKAIKVYEWALTQGMKP